MRGLDELVFSVTNRCTSQCQDCPVILVRGPKRQLKAEQMIQIINEVLLWGSLKLVVFTGVDPLILGKDLWQTVEYAFRREVKTRIVTNAYWATSPKIARQVLQTLIRAGLTEINISCDDYHQEFIPLERVKYANKAALELGLPALIAHRKKPGGKITIEYLSNFLGVKLTEFEYGKKNPDNNVICSGCNVPLERREYSQLAIEAELDHSGSTWSGPCKSVLSHIVINHDLNVQICCGIAVGNIPELTIGSLEEESLLNLLKRANRDLIVNWLALEGPSSILDFIREKAPNINLLSAYVNRCHLCNELFTSYQVRQIIRAYGSVKVPTLQVQRAVLDWISDEWIPQHHIP